MLEFPENWSGPPRAEPPRNAPVAAPAKNFAYEVMCTKWKIVR
jgi:hypothetical protein